MDVKSNMTSDEGPGPFCCHSLAPQSNLRISLRLSIQHVNTFRAPSAEACVVHPPLRHFHPPQSPTLPSTDKSLPSAQINLQPDRPASPLRLLRPPLHRHPRRGLVRPVQTDTDEVRPSGRESACSESGRRTGDEEGKEEVRCSRRVLCEWFLFALAPRPGLVLVARCWWDRSCRITDDPTASRGYKLQEISWVSWTRSRTNASSDCLGRLRGGSCR